MDIVHTKAQKHWTPIAEYVGGNFDVAAYTKENALGQTEFAIDIRSKALSGNTYWVEIEESNWQDIQDLSNAVAILLANNYDPEWCRRHFR